MGSAKALRREQDSRELLHHFHSLIGRGQVLPACDHAVILEEYCVVFRYKRLEAFRQLPCSGRSVGCQRNVAKVHDNFRKDSLFHRASGGGKSRCGGRMGMTYSMHVRSQAVEKKVHQDFGRWPSSSVNYRTTWIRHQKILGSKMPFADGCGGHKDALGIKAR